MEVDGIIPRHGYPSKEPGRHAWHHLATRPPLAMPPGIAHPHLPPCAPGLLLMRTPLARSKQKHRVLRAHGQYTMGTRAVIVCCFVWVACACATEDVLLRLQAQVSALTERRQEDFRMLEASLVKTLEKNMQLSTLREEVTALRRQVDEANGAQSGNRQKNEHLTAQWLTTAMAELRAELQEVAAAHNASAELQQRQELLTALGLLRRDVGSLRKELDDMQAAQLRSEARIGQVQQEIGTARANGQATAAACADLKAQVITTQNDWTATLRAIRKSFAFKKLFKHSLTSSTSPNDILNDVTPAKTRHQRELRVQMAELGVVEHQLHKEHSRLERRVRRLEASTHQSVSLPERVALLEAAERRVGKTALNVSRQAAGLDKIHQSVLELLETVETLETKVDKKLPEMQREVSKMEFNMAQVSSSVGLIREEQTAMTTSTKSFASGLAALQEKVDTNLGHITVIQSQLMQLANAHDDVDQLTPSSLRSLHAAPKRSDTGHLLEQMDAVQKNYRELVGRLPHDCASVSGPSGSYLIHPRGEGSPVMAYCDQDAGAGGWTLVQRRVDGVEQFNRNWTEYAKGFGSPDGEFWLGNDPLHRLTGDNCSSLRVDLRDIYGKSWTAEYSTFGVASSSDGFRLHVSGYTGNASDALDYQNNMQFSTIDSDRDASNTHCASNYEGGWWFSHCQHANLNGRYSLGLTWFDGVRNEWIAVARSEMKVRRRRDCRQGET